MVLLLYAKQYLLSIVFAEISDSCIFFFVFSILTPSKKAAYATFLPKGREFLCETHFYYTRADAVVNVAFIKAASKDGFGRDGEI